MAEIEQSQMRMTEENCTCIIWHHSDQSSAVEIRRRRCSQQAR